MAISFMEHSLALAVVLAALEDYFCDEGEDIKGDRSAAEVEEDRVSARIYFKNDPNHSYYRLHADILGVEALPVNKLALNIRDSGKKMGGKITKRSMDNLLAGEMVVG